MTREAERAQARLLGRKSNHEARSHPKSPYTGKVVGILRRQVVVVVMAVPDTVCRPGLDGIAGLRLLSSFTYGNFGELSPSYGSL